MDHDGPSEEQVALAEELADYWLTSNVSEERQQLRVAAHLDLAKFLIDRGWTRKPF